MKKEMKLFAGEQKKKLIQVVQKAPGNKIVLLRHINRKKSQHMENKFSVMESLVGYMWS